MTGLIRRARAKIDRAIVEPAFVKRGFERADSVHPGDTVIVGFPKSGHTWMQGIVAGLKYGVDAGTAPQPLIEDLVPDLHQKRWVRRYADDLVLKSHHLPKPHYRNVIYMLRDGRDVIVSYWHYRRALGFTGTLDDLIEEVHPVYANWGEHVSNWQQNPFQARMLTIRYESLKYDWLATIKQICQFIYINYEVDFNLLESWNSFHRLQEKERRQGLQHPVWPGSHAFFRRGESGAFEVEMPLTSQNRFMEKYGSLLAELGYVQRESESPATNLNDCTG